MPLPDITLLTSNAAGKIGVIILLYILAWVVFRLSRRAALYLLAASRIASRQPDMRPERKQTLISLISGTIAFLAVGLATLLSLSLFVNINTLLWMVGLFSAAFGLGARPIVSDFLSGISFMFEDNFDVSDKVELPGLAGGSVTGIVEAVHLRTTLIQSMSGEPFVVPNGEIRVVRNFSRGRFSTANIKIKIATADLGDVILLLEELGKEASSLLPNLLEPWQLVSETGEMGLQTELTLVAKARYGMAGAMRPRLLSLVQERLLEAGIELAS